jgi:ATP-dependent RNA helicase HelY
LKSSFRPGYNMAVNLVHQFGATQARELLEKSFAQFQADRSVVGLARQIEANEKALAGYAESMNCHLGDFTEYAALRRKVSDREKFLARQNTASRRAEAAASLERLRKGDVIAVQSGKRSGLAVVIDPGIDPLTDPRPLVVTEDRWAGRLSVTDFPAPVTTLGRIRLPKQVDVRSPRSRRELADSVRNAGIAPPGRERRRSTAADDAELATLRRALRAHPCHGCEQREDHARWAERYYRLAGENEQLKQRMAATTHSLARQFDRIRDLLVDRGYLTDTADGGEQDVTEHGRRLARLYSESDLLAAECLRLGVWRGLDPPELAAVVSALVYEARRDGPSEARVPAG